MVTMFSHSVYHGLLFVACMTLVVNHVYDDLAPSAKYILARESSI